MFTPRWRDLDRIVGERHNRFGALFRFEKRDKLERVRVN